MGCGCDGGVEGTSPVWVGSGGAGAVLSDDVGSSGGSGSGEVGSVGLSGGVSGGFGVSSGGSSVGSSGGSVSSREKLTEHVAIGFASPSQITNSNDSWPPWGRDT